MADEVVPAGALREFLSDGRKNPKFLDPEHDEWSAAWDEAARQLGVDPSRGGVR